MVDYFLLDLSIGLVFGWTQGPGRVEARGVDEKVVRVYYGDHDYSDHSYRFSIAQREMLVLLSVLA